MNITENAERKMVMNKDSLHRALLFSVLALGVTLRFYNLGSESYWLDEVIMARLTGGSLEAVLIDLRDSGRPPLYVILAHLWVRAFGVGETATRSLSALIGSGSLVLMYLVGRELFGRRVGLLSTLLMALSTLQIYQSQNFRYYSLFVFMTLLSFLVFIYALKSRRHALLGAYVIVTALLFLSHTFAIFVIAAQNLYFLLCWKKFAGIRASWFVSQALILAAIGFRLLRSLLAQAAAAQNTGGESGAILWIPKPRVKAPLDTLFQHVFAGPEALHHIPDHLYVSYRLLTVVGVAALLLGIAVCLALWRGKAECLDSLQVGIAEMRNLLANKRSELLLVGCWLTCPIIIPFALSMLWAPMYLVRYTMAAAPALYIVLALAIVKTRRLVPEMLCIGAVACLIAPWLYMYYATPSREQWRETAAYIEEHAGSKDVIVVAGDAQEGGTAFRWYYGGKLPTCDLSHRLSDDEAIAEELGRCTDGGKRFWLVVRRGPRFIMGRLEKFFFGRDHDTMEPVEKADFKGISVHLFVLKGE